MSSNANLIMVEKMAYHEQFRLLPLNILKSSAAVPSECVYKWERIKL